jgi:gluconolactonase
MRAYRAWTREAITAAVAVMGAALASGGPAPAALSAVAIERLDPRFDALVPRDAAWEYLQDGFRWAEGPAWDRREGVLYFSDVVANRLYRWRAGEGARVHVEGSGYTGARPFAGKEPGSNGLALDAEGRILACQHGNRRIVRFEKDGRVTVLADRYQGMRLSSPNDLIVDAGGEVLFTDPPFGLPGGAKDPGKETPWNGVYRVAKDGSLRLLTKDVPYPNGLALSPDGRTLYVANADADAAKWFAFDVLPGGDLANRRVFHDATDLARRKPGLGVPDGLKVDASGNLFATGPGGSIFVLSPRGELLGRIVTGVPTANLAWGEDGSVLYVTANTAIARLRTSTRGKEW